MMMKYKPTYGKTIDKVMDSVAEYDHPSYGCWNKQFDVIILVWIHVNKHEWKKCEPIGREVSTWWSCLQWPAFFALFGLLLQWLSWLVCTCPLAEDRVSFSPSATTPTSIEEHAATFPIIHKLLRFWRKIGSLVAPLMLFLWGGSWKMSCW